MYTDPRALTNVPWRSALAVAIASLTFPSGALRAADVYKSVDAQGHAVYSDQADTSSSGQTPVDVDGSSPAADAEVDTTEAPPPLPDYQQPPCPQEGYLWTPGYWAWSAAGYYWVPGVWMQPPEVGVLWTPGYWGFVGAVYVFHRGYWAHHVGYYGGINYRFGYFGAGYAGGRWVGSSFAYNRSASNVDAHMFHNTYEEPADHNAAVSRVSYNGGPEGTRSVPTAEERAVAAERHIAPTQWQRQNMMQAARTPTPMPHMSAAVTRPAPGADHRAVAVRPKPATFSAPAVVRTRATAAAPYLPHRELTHASPNTNAPRPQATLARASTPAPTRTTAIKAPRPLH